MDLIFALFLDKNNGGDLSFNFNHVGVKIIVSLHDDDHANGISFRIR